jgi:hypothetical protein
MFQAFASVLAGEYLRLLGQVCRTPAAASGELRDQRDDPDGEEQPNPRADGIDPDQAQNPQNEENHS